jgi:hypothetical protein
MEIFAIGKLYRIIFAAKFPQANAARGKTLIHLAGMVPVLPRRLTSFGTRGSIILATKRPLRAPKRTRTRARAGRRAGSQNLRFCHPAEPENSVDTGRALAYLGFRHLRLHVTGVITPWG